MWGGNYFSITVMHPQCQSRCEYCSPTSFRSLRCRPTWTLNRYAAPDRLKRWHFCVADSSSHLHLFNGNVRVFSCAASYWAAIGPCVEAQLQVTFKQQHLAELAAVEHLQDATECHTQRLALADKLRKAASQHSRCAKSQHAQVSATASSFLPVQQINQNYVI